MATYDCPRCGQVHPRGCIGHRSAAPKLDNGHAPPCGQPPAVGQEVCRYHGGATPQAKRKAGERIERAAVVVEARRLGVRVEIDPGEALLAAQYVAYGELRYLESRVAELDASEVYGSLYHHTGEPTGEAKRHILIQMLEDATDRLARISALALRAGVDERRLRLAEADARNLGTEVFGALADVDAPAELAERFKAALAERLRRLGGLPPAA